MLEDNLDKQTLFYYFYQPFSRWDDPDDPCTYCDCFNNTLSCQQDESCLISTQSPVSYAPTTKKALLSDEGSISPLITTYSKNLVFHNYLYF